LKELTISIDQLVDQVMAELSKQSAVKDGKTQVDESRGTDEQIGTSRASRIQERVTQALDESIALKQLAGNVPSPKWKDGMQELLASTPSRIGVWRTGTRPLTSTMLSLRNDHAAAIDAVYSQVPMELIHEYKLCFVETNYINTETFLRRPDKGRTLTNEAMDRIKQQCIHKPQVQIVIADGLSANAITANLKDIYPSLMSSLEVYGLSVGTPLFVKGGRVGCMNHIGDILEPDVLVMLIGERPGLVSSESMSAYMCYKPKQHTVESDRNVISNIHLGGTSPIEAGAHIGTVLHMMLEQQISGVKLAM